MTSPTTRPTVRAGRIAALASAGPSGASIAFAWHGAVALAISAPLILPVALLLLVVAPAVWSRKDDRRTAAINVLDRLLGRAAEAPAVDQLEPHVPRSRRSPTGSSTGPAASKSAPVTKHPPTRSRRSAPKR